MSLKEGADVSPEKIASSAKSVGENRWLIAAKRREPLESCP
jgi:hypothetical protein